MDPLDAIAAFARVADSGSFSAAARRLDVSKSAVRPMCSGLRSAWAFVSSTALHVASH